MDLSHLAYLTCPVCTSSPSPSAPRETHGTSAPHKSQAWNSAESNTKRLVCSHGHSFDAAKQGYFNFLVGSKNKFIADGAELVAARERFLLSGSYEKLKDAIHEQVSTPEIVFDAGCGTGYYSLGLPYSRLFSTDLSPHALRRAAKLPRNLAFAWDLWRPLPLKERCVNTVLNVFAPHNFPEFTRILVPGGRLIVVTPAPGHLDELREKAPMLQQATNKLEALDQQAKLDLSARKRLEIPLELSQELACDAVFMGPAGHHYSRAKILQGLEEEFFSVTARFDISVYTVE